MHEHQSEGQEGLYQHEATGEGSHKVGGKSVQSQQHQPFSVVTLVRTMLSQAKQTPIIQWYRN